MEDINYFKDIFESIHDYKKIVLLIFLIKKDIGLLNDFGLSNDTVEKLYNDCKNFADDKIE